MNKVESFALQSALKISEPFIESHFYPTLSDEYITVHSHGEEEARNYSHLQETIDLISPILKKEGISIYQIGSDKDIPLQNCHSLLNQTSINQCSYIIQNSMLHFGVDSFPLHLSSFHNVPTIGIYSNKPKRITAPLWNPEKQTHIETFKKYPSYSPVEDPKSINTLMPEVLARSILDKLTIAHKLKSYKTLHIGNLYYSPVFEMVPDFTPPQDFLPRNFMNIRLDYACNPDILPLLCANRKVALFISEPIDLRHLMQFRENIERINVDVDKLKDEDYCNQLKHTGIFTALFSKDKDNIKELRREFFDWRIELINQKTKKDLDSGAEKCDNMQYKSRKLTFSKGKTYLSKAAWKNGIEKGDTNYVIDSDLFWEELDHFCIFKTNEKKES